MKVIGSILLSFLLLELSSCVNTRPIQYAQGQFDTAQLSKYEVTEPLIQQGDILSITVFSDNPQAAAIYNQSGTSGYLVDVRGNIQFQGLGNLHVEGLTKQQLTDLLNSRLTEFLQNPYYNIRFLNYKVTLIGEVAREGIYPISNERVNILEVIGLAGGLTVYARRENVMIIREANGKREFARLDLTKPDIFGSPYYFLKQNDMIVIEQTKNKRANTDQSTVRNISVLTGVISTLVFVYTVFR